MTRIELQSHFRCPPDVAFAALSDHESLRGLPGLRSVLVEEGSPSRNGVGALRSIGASGVVMLEEVTAFEDGKFYEYRIVGGTLPLDHDGGRVEVSASGDGTEVVWSTAFAVRAPLIGGLLTALAKPMIRLSLDRILDSARRQAEA